MISQIVLLGFSSSSNEYGNYDTFLTDFLLVGHRLGSIMCVATIIDDYLVNFLRGGTSHTT